MRKESVELELDIGMRKEAKLRNSIIIIYLGIRMSQ
jgi:hypothetical protein